MCYQGCRYECFNGECQLESDAKPPIDAMCRISDLGAEVVMLRDLVSDCHALLQRVCNSQDDLGTNCPLWPEHGEECDLRKVERRMSELGVGVEP